VAITVTDTVTTTTVLNPGLTTTVTITLVRGSPIVTSTVEGNITLVVKALCGFIPSQFMCPTEFTFSSNSDNRYSKTTNYAGV
jgi:hypothetical protein